MRRRHGTDGLWDVLAADSAGGLVRPAGEPEVGAYPDNDPDAARRLMHRFYRQVTRATGERFDIAEAARLEVAWWRAHRELQRERPGAGDEELVDALAALYAHVYGIPAADGRQAGRLRAEAMRLSDTWVEAGCDPTSPLVDGERVALVRSYATLLAAVYR